MRERLYRDAIDRAINVAMVRWVPPPSIGKYNGFRITLESPKAGLTSDQEKQKAAETENEDD